MARSRLAQPPSRRGSACATSAIYPSPNTWSPPQPREKRRLNIDTKTLLQIKLTEPDLDREEVPASRA